MGARGGIFVLLKLVVLDGEKRFFLYTAYYADFGFRKAKTFAQCRSVMFHEKRVRAHFWPTEI